MHSTLDTYRSSSTVRNTRLHSPSPYLDLGSSGSGSDRAEFRDRYQNRVKYFQEKIKMKMLFVFVFSMPGSKKITSLKLAHNTIR